MGTDDQPFELKLVSPVTRRPVEINTDLFASDEIDDVDLAYRFVLIELVGLLSDDGRHVMIPVEHDDAVDGIIAMINHDHDIVSGDRDTVVAAAVGFWMGRGMLKVIDGDSGDDGARTVPLMVRIHEHVTTNLVRLSKDV